MLGFPVFTAGAESILVREGLFNGVIGWTIMRFGMVGLWLRAAAASTGRLRRTALTYAVGITLTQSLWWVFFFIIPKYDATVFLATGLAIYLVEFAVPVVAERGSPTPWHRHHMIERYGLLTFIILGEVLLSVSMMLGTLYDGHAEPGLIGQRCRALSSWSASGGCISSPKTI